MKEEKKVTKKVNDYAGLQFLLLAPIALMIKLWTRTLRFKKNEELLRRIEENPAFIVLFWHNRLFCAVEAFHRLSKGRKMAALMSASKDGGYLATFCKLMGVFPIRGSSSFRGAQAMREIVQALNNGYSFSITPDGPKGPKYQIKPGILAVAKKTEAPILLLSWEYDKYWELKSWDKFRLPRPFTRVTTNIKYYKNYEAMAECKEDSEMTDYVSRTLIELDA